MTTPVVDKYRDTASLNGSAKGNVTDEEWRRVNRGRDRHTDIRALLAGGLPNRPRPLNLSRDDGNALLYDGQVNVLFGEPESGKTMLALAAIAEVAKQVRRTAFADVDHNGAEVVIPRLVALGVPVDYLCDPDLFRYVEPEDADDLRDVVAYMRREWRPALVVVDSVGEMLPMLGLSSNSPDDYTQGSRAVMQPMADTGSCVVAIDHVNREGTGGPTGTAAKRRAAGGTMLRVKVNERFVPGKGGSAWLSVHKDRSGGVREHCPRVPNQEDPAGLFQLTACNERLTWNIKAPHIKDALNISGVTDEDLAALSELDPPPTTVRDVKDRMSWSSQRALNTLRIWKQRHELPGLEIPE